MPNVGLIRISGKILLNWLGLDNGKILGVRSLYGRRFLMIDIAVQHPEMPLFDENSEEPVGEPVIAPRYILQPCGHYTLDFREYVWHLNNDDRLVEPLRLSLKDVKEYIKSNEPIEKQPLRLKLLKKVKGQLPQAVTEAIEVCLKEPESEHKTFEVYNKAYKAYLEAMKDNLTTIKALHKQECPNCPWNGTTIFTRKDNEGIWY